MSLSAGVVSSPHLWAALRGGDVPAFLVKYLCIQLTHEPERWRSVVATGKFSDEDRVHLKSMLLEFGADPRPGVQVPTVKSLPHTKSAAHGDVGSLDPAFNWEGTEQRSDYWGGINTSGVMPEDVSPVLELWHERNQDLFRHRFWNERKFDEDAIEEFLAGELGGEVWVHVRENLDGNDRCHQFMERLEKGSAGVIRELLHAAGLHYNMNPWELGLDGPKSVGVIEALRDQRYVEAGVFWAEELNAQEKTPDRAIVVLESFKQAEGKVKRAIARRVADAHQSHFIDYGPGKPPTSQVRSHYQMALAALQEGKTERTRELMMATANAQDGSCPRIASLYWGISGNRDGLRRRLEYLVGETKS